MTTAANLLVILLYLSALYTILGLLCGAAEKIQELIGRPQKRRRVRKSTRRRTPRREVAGANGGTRTRKPLRAAAQGEAA